MNRVNAPFPGHDYYQPEAYVPVSDTYIAKTASINEEIDMLRHSARSLFERRDVIVVASIGYILAGDSGRIPQAAVKFEVGETLSIAVSWGAGTTSTAMTPVSQSLPHEG